jgi:hypothetical protein
VYEEVRERRSRDQRLLVRNLLIAINACTSVFLMVAMVGGPSTVPLALTPRDGCG